MVCRADNILRATCEFHILLIIAIGLALKVEKVRESFSDPTRLARDSQLLGQGLVGTFVLAVPMSFLVTVGWKFSYVHGVLEQTYSQDEEGDCDTINSFHRFQIGLATPADIRQLNVLVDLLLKGEAGNKHMDAGRRVWRNKMVASHLEPHGIKAVLDVLTLQMRLNKAEEFAIHFTSKESARLILHGYGIRASTEGQLAGGVSVCVSSLKELGWKAGRPKVFRENTGRALWGSKCKCDCS
jgi:hypothetical protein